MKIFENLLYYNEYKKNNVRNKKNVSFFYSKNWYFDIVNILYILNF